MPAGRAAEPPYVPPAMTSRRPSACHVSIVAPPGVGRWPPRGVPDSGSTRRSSAGDPSRPAGTGRRRRRRPGDGRSRASGSTSAARRSASSTTTARLSMLPTARIATCGWLMIGSPHRPPKMPGLVSVNVPPSTSSTFSCLARARCARSCTARQSSSRLLRSARADHRHDQSLLERHGNPQVDVVLVDDVLAVERGVDVRELPDRVGRRLGDERRVGEAGALGLVVAPCVSGAARRRGRSRLRRPSRCGPTSAGSSPCARRSSGASRSSSRCARRRPAGTTGARGDRAVGRRARR